MYRTIVLVACAALGTTALVFAQSTPPANSTMSPSNPTSTQTPSDATSSNSSSNSAPSADKVGQDPKMKTCMKSEKAKNAGLSEDQLKQKCMMQIASHQDQSK